MVLVTDYVYFLVANDVNNKAFFAEENGWQHDFSCNILHNPLRNSSNTIYNTECDLNTIIWLLSLFQKQLLPWSTNSEAKGTPFWFFIKTVDQGLLPSERGLTLQ